MSHEIILVSSIKSSKRGFNARLKRTLNLHGVLAINYFQYITRNDLMKMHGLGASSFFAISDEMESLGMKIGQFAEHEMPEGLWKDKRKHKEAT